MLDLRAAGESPPDAADGDHARDVIGGTARRVEA